jgi:hypothetical protein
VFVFLVILLPFPSLLVIVSLFSPVHPLSVSFPFSSFSLVRSFSLFISPIHSFVHLALSKHPLKHDISSSLLDLPLRSSFLSLTLHSIFSLVCTQPNCTPINSSPPPQDQSQPSTAYHCVHALYSPPNTPHLSSSFFFSPSNITNIHIFLA